MKEGGSAKKEQENTISVDTSKCHTNKGRDKEGKTDGTSRKRHNPATETVNCLSCHTHLSCCNNSSDSHMPRMPFTCPSDPSNTRGDTYARRYKRDGRKTDTCTQARKRDRPDDVASMSTCSAPFLHYLFQSCSLTP